MNVQDFVVVVFFFVATEIREIFGKLFFILNFRRVLNVVCFLLGNSSAPEYYVPTFRNTLSVPFTCL
jgi:hypothetical protein